MASIWPQKDHYFSVNVDKNNKHLLQEVTNKNKVMAKFMGTTDCKIKPDISRTEKPEQNCPLPVFSSIVVFALSRENDRDLKHAPLVKKCLSSSTWGDKQGWRILCLWFLRVNIFKLLTPHPPAPNQWKGQQWKGWVTRVCFILFCKHWKAENDRTGY